MKIWKRAFALLIAAALLLGALPAATATAADPADPTKPLKILAIGNSFSNNATDYLYKVFAAEGYENVTLGRLYHSGCNLKQHVQYLTNNEQQYTYYKNTDNAWVSHTNSTMLDGLLDEDWDLITMQQSSTYSGRPATYGDDLDTLVSFVNENRTNPNAKYFWHMTWAYQGSYTGNANFGAFYSANQLGMYNSIVGAVTEKVLPRTDFVNVIPSGTAIQNARSSFIGDNLNSDGTHLNDKGKLIASYVWFCVLTGRTSLDEMKFTGITGGVTADEAKVMTEAVNAALARPLELTPSVYPAAPAAVPCNGVHGSEWIPIGSAADIIANSSTPDNTTAEKYYLPEGKYYLTADVEFDKTICISVRRTVDFCLNGHTLKGTATEKYSSNNFVMIGATGSSGSGTLNLCDCAGGGKLQASVGEKTATASYVLAVYNGTFNFFGGSICDSHGRYGVVFVGSTKVSDSGGSAPGVINMYDDARMYGNNGVSIANDVEVQNSGVFNMYGGSIDDSAASTGKFPAVQMNSNAAKGSGINLYGGSITSRSGYSAVSRSGSSSGTVTVFGDVFSGGSKLSGVATYPVTAGGAAVTAATPDDPAVYTGSGFTYDAAAGALVVTDPAAAVRPADGTKAVTLKLETDWTGDQLRTVPAATAYTVDLNGHTLTVTGGEVKNYGVLTVTDTSAAHSGKLVAAVTTLQSGTLNDPDGLVAAPAADEMRGDLTGDGKVNGKDVTLLQRHVAGGYGVTLALSVADLTGDGKVNGKDVSQLQRFVAGGYGVTL